LKREETSQKKKVVKSFFTFTCEKGDEKSTVQVALPIRMASYY